MLSPHSTLDDRMDLSSPEWSLDYYVKMRGIESMIMIFIVYANGHKRWLNLNLSVRGPSPRRPKWCTLKYVGRRHGGLIIIMTSYIWAQYLGGTLLPIVKGLIKLVWLNLICVSLLYSMITGNL